MRATVILLLVGWGTVATEAQTEDSRPEVAVGVVESLAIQVFDSFPLRVEIELAGHLPDPCSWLEWIQIDILQEEGLIRLGVGLARDSDAVCAQVLEPYRHTITIDLSGFPDGEYSVTAGEASGSFQVESDSEFPAFGFPPSGSDAQIVIPAISLRFTEEGDWERSGLTWRSPGYLGARMGVRWHSEVGVESMADLLPPGGEPHGTSPSRLGWVLAERFRLSRDEGALWSEHVLAACTPDLICEFWLEAPSEPLLEAAGEAFWRVVRFAVKTAIGD